jgi:hypothetical protein
MVPSHSLRRLLLASLGVTSGIALLPGFWVAMVFVLHIREPELFHFNFRDGFCQTVPFSETCPLGTRPVCINQITSQLYECMPIYCSPQLLWECSTSQLLCLPPTAKIAAPGGPVAARAIEVGMTVWTINEAGQRMSAPVRQVSKIRIRPGHQMIQIVLTDGRSITVSPGHPLASGQPISSLRPGDALDGSEVRTATQVPYYGQYTFDLLPTGPTGLYWADGVLLGSTLRDRHAQSKTSVGTLARQSALVGVVRGRSVTDR